MATKKIENLTVDDLMKHPIWRYRRITGTAVEPVLEVPCADLDEKLVGTQVTLADGTRVWALLSNIAPNDPKFTKHFLTILIERNGQWFDLARYHDIRYQSDGPLELSKFLGKAVDDIFPITFDVRSIFQGESAVLCSRIEKEPGERLKGG